MVNMSIFSDYMMTKCSILILDQLRFIKILVSNCSISPLEIYLKPVKLRYKK